MVRDGQLASVREVTIASTLQRILLDGEVGSDLTCRAAARAYTLLVTEMTMSG
jgi:hypothetical protein